MSSRRSSKAAAALRQIPVAHGREREEGDASAEPRRSTARVSEVRLQVAVGRPDGAAELYADVPCTD